MKAVCLAGARQPLVVKEVPTPVPGPGEVLVRLHHAAFNHRDLLIQQGQYSVSPVDLIPGSDGAGTVEGLGPGSDESLLGAKVLIYPAKGWGIKPVAHGRGFEILGGPAPGTFAECIVVPGTSVYPQPGHLDDPEAAALPLAGLTTFRALFTRARLDPGERVLITGIGGGTALMALGFALARGAEVYVTSGSPEKIKKAIALGAKGGLNYRDPLWPEQFRDQLGGFDVILDSTSGPHFERLIDAAAPGGRIVFFGATAGAIGNILPRKIFWNNLSILGTTMGTQEEFASMLQFCATHRIGPVIDRVFASLYDAQDALDLLLHGGQFGKIVMRTIITE